MTAWHEKNSAKATGRIKECLDLIFGQDTGNVNVRRDDLWVRLHGGNIRATTRWNLVLVRGPISRFWADSETVLHEYYHVLRQWNTGRLGRMRYLWASRRGYLNNRLETEAMDFAANNLKKFQDCLDDDGQTNEGSPCADNANAANNPPN